MRHRDHMPICFSIPSIINVRASCSTRHFTQTTDVRFWLISFIVKNKQNNNVRNSSQGYTWNENTHFFVHKMNSKRKLEVNLSQVVQIKVCHQPRSKLFIYGERSELQDNASPFQCCSRVTYHNTSKWRACSQAGLLFPLNVTLNLCNDDS